MISKAHVLVACHRLYRSTQPALHTFRLASLLWCLASLGTVLFLSTCALLQTCRLFVIHARVVERCRDERRRQQCNADSTADSHLGVFGYDHVIRHRLLSGLRLLRRSRTVGYKKGNIVSDLSFTFTCFKRRWVFSRLPGKYLIAIIGWLIN